MSVIDRLLVQALRVAHSVRSGERGQGLAEYALILGLVAALCVAALTGLRGSISNALNSAAGAF